MNHKIRLAIAGASLALLTGSTTGPIVGATLAGNIGGSNSGCAFTLGGCRLG
jgi:hypothetical protein